MLPDNLSTILQTLDADQANTVASKQAAVDGAAAAKAALEASKHLDEVSAASVAKKAADLASAKALLDSIYGEPAPVS